MTIGQKGINLIKEFEGCQLIAYLCPASVPTIGFGETGTFTLTGQKIQLGLTITQKQADESFIMTLEKKGYIKSVQNLGVELNQNQFDALVSFAYNLGTGIFKGSLLTAIKAKNWNNVTSQMMLYNKARVNGVLTELKGLTRRRKAEVELFNTPVAIAPVEDKELSEAVSKIIKSGISLTFNQWKRVDLIKLTNVPALLTKMGGLDKLVADGIIGDKALWQNKKYNTNHVRSLIIKYASKIRG